MSLFTEYEFSKCVKPYKGDRHAIKFNCRDQFLVMSLAQFTTRSGLRDIETTLDLCSQDLYRLKQATYFMVKFLRTAMNGIVTQFRFKLAFGRFYLALAKIVKTS